MSDKRPLIIFGVAAVLLLIFFMISSGRGNRFDWKESYKPESKDPYGTFVVKELLNGYFPNQPIKLISEGLSTDLPLETEPANYVFIGEGLYMDTTDVNQLLDFVSAGNQAFISSKSIPYDLMFYIYYQECNDYIWDDYEQISDTAVIFNMLHRNLQTAEGFEYKFMQRDQASKYRWNYIDSIYFCEEDYSFVELGAINDRYVNFAKMNHGEGAFYLHTNPLAFTNIQLLDEQGVDYAEKVFSHLTPGPIYWDKHSQVAEAVSRRRNQRNNYYGSERSFESEGPLSYILKQPSLAWAWYLLLALGLFYLVFRAKRKQRIIPVYEPNRNTSLEFISTLGTIYFMQNDHKKLCLQKMRLFLSYVRERYHLPTKEINNEFVDKLSSRSEVSPDIIKNIIKYFQNIKSSTFVSENTMIDFHLAVHQFYQTRK